MALDRWGFADTRFQAESSARGTEVYLTSERYLEAIRGRANGLLDFFALNHRVLKARLHEAPVTKLPEADSDVAELLTSMLPAEIITLNCKERLRAGSDQSLSDIWKLRHGSYKRMPDMVVKPRGEDDVRI